jgi:hypothetical protein
VTAAGIPTCGSVVDPRVVEASRLVSRKCTDPTSKRGAIGPLSRPRSSRTMNA